MSRGLSRRDFFTALFRRDAAAAATGGLVATQLLAGATSAKASLRPPGAQPERTFLAACIKCGQCVEACPFDTLRLASVSDPQAVGTPFFEPREVPCEMCPDVPCAAACPTDALAKRLDINQADMGLAVLIDHETCLAFLGLRCEACYRACPKLDEAITLDYVPQERTGKHAFFLPVVHADACTGCGKCEHVCVIERPAIKVLPRAQATGQLGDHYQLGWEQRSDITPDFTPSTSQPQLSDDGDAVDAMNDMSIFEDP